MLIDHDHPPDLFDAGHCGACAHQAGLLDHYDRVQDQETNLRQAREWASAAHRYATWALGSSAIGVLLARPPSSRHEPASTGSCNPPEVDIGPGCPPGGRHGTVSQRPTAAATPLRTVELCLAPLM